MGKALPILSLSLALAIGLAALPSCDDDGCLESGEQCSSASECCSGVCAPAQSDGVHRCN
jgi:hypothetical protein